MSMPKFASKDITEVVPVTFRFPEIGANDAIVSATLTAAVWAVTGGAGDAAPQTIVRGTADVQEGAVEQVLGGGVAGVTYVLTCTATTAAGLVRVKRGTMDVTGLIVPSSDPAAPSIATFSTISVATIVYGGVELVATPAELNFLSGVTSGLQAQFDLKAPLSSPAFTDIPTAPTAAVGTSSTQIANTAFVGAQIAASSPALAPVQSVAGRTGVVVLAKGDVGLGNVDNTSDEAKPISTATAAALASYFPLAGGDLSGPLTFGGDVRFRRTGAKTLAIDDGTGAALTSLDISANTIFRSINLNNSFAWYYLSLEFFTAAKNNSILYIPNSMDEAWVNLRLRGRNAQSAPLTVWESPNGTAVASVSPDGALSATSATFPAGPAASAPASGWKTYTDSSDGKLKAIKSDGTIAVLTP